MYKGLPIMLTAGLSAEILKERREWHDVFKVMKGKNLQPRLLYSTRVSFRFDGEIKIFTEKQKLSFLLSFTTNAKGTSLDRKHKRRKRPTITNPKQLRKW